MQALESTRNRLILAAVLTVMSVLLLFTSLRVRAAESRAAAAPTATPAATAVAVASPTAAPTTAATTAGGTVTPTARRTPTATRAASPVAGTPTPPTAASFGLTFTTEQLAADYASVRQALQQREPNAGLYAVAVIFARGEASVETQFQLLSADGKRLYSYSVKGTNVRNAGQRAGSPEPVTSEARFVTYQTPPWQIDANWPSYFEQGAAQLARGNWAAPENITKATIVARTEIPNDWELFFESGPRRFHFNVIQGNLTFTKVHDPAQPIELPPVAERPWSGFAGKEMFARNFRVAPYGLSDGEDSGFTPAGYQLACQGGACTPFAATTLPSGSFGDVVVEAQFFKVSGPDDPQYGLLVHAGAPDYLVFAVNGNGRFTVAQGQPSGQPILLGQGDVATFQRGNFTNTLVAVLSGGTARFFVNDVEVWQGQVASKSTGDCAVVTTDPNVRVAVQYARVFEPRRNQ